MRDLARTEYVTRRFGGSRFAMSPDFPKRCQVCHAIIGACASWGHAHKGFVVTTCASHYCRARGPLLAADARRVLSALYLRELHPDETPEQVRRRLDLISPEALP